MVLSLFFRILHFRKKICLPIFAGLSVSISEFEVKFEVMCLFFLYFVSHFGEKFDHL